MELKGRPWQLCHNYVHEKQTNIKIQKKKGKKKEREKERRKKEKKKEVYTTSYEVHS